MLLIGIIGLLKRTLVIFANYKEDRRMKFLRNLLAAILGSLIAFGIVFFMFMIFVSLLSVEEVITVKNNSVLELRTPYPIKDYTGADDSDPLLAFLKPSKDWTISCTLYP